MAERAHSVIMFCALFCTLAVKLFYSYRMDQLSRFITWIPADIAVLLGIEVVLTITCFRWRRRRVVRIAAIIAAVICTWSVMNAGWLIRTGTQILPTVILPLVRDPLNSLGIVGVNLIKMPLVAVSLLGPSAVALAFLFSVLAKPRIPDYNRKRFVRRTVIYTAIVIAAILAAGVVRKTVPVSVTSARLRYNCQLKAVTALFSTVSNRLTNGSPTTFSRKIPAFDEIKIENTKPSKRNYNVVVLVLEGVQYRYTSLYDSQSELTPYLASMAKQGAEFTNTRSTVSHTTKVLFSLLTGRYPSVSQDIAEAVPVAKPYAGLATILKQTLNFRTAFFQSAKGNFECRPGLVSNLGFDKFWARDDSGDPSAFLGSLGSDEFSMLKPITEWIKADTKPFLLTVLCSVTHDPYQVPKWFDTPAKEPIDRYKQAVFYTDRFIAALDAVLTELNLSEKTIFCVIGDHGEAFGEHGLLGHERIAFEEVLRVPWVIRAPSLVSPERKVTQPVSSIDLTATLLALLGLDTNTIDFDGTNALAAVPDDRKVYFSGWMEQSPAGFVQDNLKFIYNPSNKMVSVYDLDSDAFERARTVVLEPDALKIADEVIGWRKNSMFGLSRQRAGTKVLFDFWHCRWSGRVSSAKYSTEPKK